ncbi:hypothetical protein BDN70DRAFT_133091 [Pholiota conissans]|uniref:F-box domain-containing protein n=1 Tax=Pholiota conissans TaxID=109636 RepID=A0A9P5YZR6_9AGAR|nr:hypothetical protein BDN70DRAFT_133091 [Pholiota conissans]
MWHDHVIQHLAKQVASTTHLFNFNLRVHHLAISQPIFYSPSAHNNLFNMASFSVQQVITPVAIACSRANGGTCDSCEALLRFQTGTFTIKSSEMYANTVVACRQRHVNLLRQVNKVHDPFQRHNLPTEVQCLIFEALLSQLLARDAAQVTIMSVCSNWRRVVVTDSHCWKKITLPYMKLNRCSLKISEEFIRRSKCLSIDIDFRTRSLFDNMRTNWPLLDMILAQKHRIRTINSTDSSSGFPLASLGERVAEWGLWPRLERIDIGFVYVDQLLDIFKHSPQLYNVKINGFMGSMGSDLDMSSTGNVFKPKVDVHQRLMILDITALFEVRLDFLFERMPSMPGLDEVSTRGHIICPAPALERFLRRSNCILTKLTLSYPGFDELDLVSLLQSQPSITTLFVMLHLQIVIPPNQTQASIEALNTILHLLVTDENGEAGNERRHTTSSFLPNLEVFRFAGQTLFSWDILADVHSAHSEITDEARLKFLQDASNDKPVSFRPLRMVSLKIAEWVSCMLERPNRPTEEQLSRLTSHSSGDRGCRFECDCDLERAFDT